MDLLTPRRTSGFDRFDAMVLALYAGTLAWAIPHHRAWADEAQAWLIARDSSLHELLFRRLHYEGAPALWPLLLWAAARMHLPYAGLNWLGGCVAVAGVYLLLRYSPFPRLFRWLIPFTFFVQYQFAVIARPYTLFPVLLFLLCMLFTLERPRPVLFALVAGLMANVSLHAAMLAGMFSLLYLDHLRRVRRTTPVRVSRRSVTTAVAVFSLLAAFSAAVAFPAPDGSFPAASKATSMGRMHGVLLRLLPEEPALSAQPLDPPLDGRQLTPVRSNPVAAIARGVLFALNSACYPVARSNVLAVSLLGCFAIWLWSIGCLRMALPFAVAILSTVGIWVYDHHTGLFLLALVAAAWIAMKLPVSTPRLLWVQPLFAMIALIVIVLQISWTVHCIRAEAVAEYDPGRATEEFLVMHYAGKKIAGFSYETVSVQTYSDHNLFFNQPKSYWVWSEKVSIDRRRSEALAQHPDVVVVADFVSGGEAAFNQWLPIWPEGDHPYRGMLEFWQTHGYQVTHTFCGSRLIRLGVTNTVCEDIFEPVGNSGARPD